jgi:DnaJ family protein C protein 28
MTEKSEAQSSELDTDWGSARQRRLRSAVDRANEYHEATERSGIELEEDNDHDTVRPMEEWGDLVSQRIEDAVRQGLFDGLSGHGKPLDLDRDPFVPEDQKMAVNLLRNNRLAPEWISERNAILASIDAMRTELRVAKSRADKKLDETEDEERRSNISQRWVEWLTGWCGRVGKLNDRILVHNLKLPVSHLEIVQLRLPNELDDVGIEYEAVDWPIAPKYR